MQKENPAFEFWFSFFTPAFLLPGLKAETNGKSQLPAKVTYHKCYKHSNKYCFMTNWVVRAVKSVHFKKTVARSSYLSKL